MSQNWPTTSDVLAAMDRAEVAETAEAPKPELTKEEAPDASKLAEAAKVEGQPDAQPKQPASTVDLAAIIQTVREKGPKSPEARALLDSLDEDAQSALEAVLLPKLQAKLSRRSNELSESRALLEGMRQLDSASEARHDELMTAGLSDEDRTKYFAERKVRKDEESKRGDETRAREGARRLGTLWQIIHSAGLPVDMDERGYPRADGDPEVHKLWEGVWANEDFDAVVREFVTQAPQIAERRRGAARAAPAGAKNESDKTFSAAEVKEILRVGINEALLKSGMLAPDTGRPGASGGSIAKPRSDAERRRLVEQMLG